MSIELKVPEVGESVSEVQIGEWAFREGDLVEQDRALVAIETDKVTVEITAPTRGRLTKILLHTGAPARVGDVVGLFEIEEARTSDSSAPPESRVEGTQPGAPPSPMAQKSSTPSEGPKSGAEEPESRTLASATAPWASPAARRALAERGLRPEDVAASGGRLLKEDVSRHLDESANARSREDAAPRAGEGTTRERTSAVTGPESFMPADAMEEVVKMSPLRQKVAERLLESQQTMALLTTFNEVDMHAVQELRHELKEAFQAKHGVKLGLMGFFVRAAVEALKMYPIVNAEVRGTDIVYKNHYDIGIAIGGGRGLVVPVLRNAERLGFAAIERAIGEFAVKAKDNKLELKDLTGGTFTISNGGVYGSMLSTPIVNPPQSAILGLHAISDRPVARQGSVVIRPMMYVALTYDHRIIDGREAVSFLRMVKDLVENPVRLLLEV